MDNVDNVAKKPSIHDDPLDEILLMCKGEIVSRVPNLQLFHFMLVYGHCGGSEGVCMDSTFRVASIQNRIYERHMQSMTHNFSSAEANNYQSKFVPNDWVDTFCKLMVDANIGIPRSQSLAAAMRDPSSTLAKVRNEADALASMMQSGCAQCYDRRIIDMPSSLPHPDIAVAKHFPSASVLAECGDKCKHALREWMQKLFQWISCMYECSCLCCFEDLPASVHCLRVPSPKRMGMSKVEFDDWSSVITCMARRRVRSILSNMIPTIDKCLDDPKFSADHVEQILVACWNQVSGHASE